MRIVCVCTCIMCVCACACVRDREREREGLMTVIELFGLSTLSLS